MTKPSVLGGPAMSGTARAPRARAAGRSQPEPRIDERPVVARDERVVRRAALVDPAAAPRGRRGLARRSGSASSASACPAASTQTFGPQAGAGRGAPEDVAATACRRRGPPHRRRPSVRKQRVDLGRGDVRALVALVEERLGRALADGAWPASSRAASARCSSVRSRISGRGTSEDASPPPRAAGSGLRSAALLSRPSAGAPRRGPPAPAPPRSCRRRGRRRGAGVPRRCR